MIDFPSPILSVASDVVKELEGEDAVYGLWTVFTKCKASLTDGRRLENISWRLWYREMSSNSLYSHSPGSVSPPSSEDRSPTPITPVSEDGPAGQHEDLPRDSLMPGEQRPAARSWHGENLAPTAVNVSRRLSTASMPARPNTKGAPSRVGKLIVGILPDKLDIPPRRSVSKPGTTLSPNPTPSQILQPRPVVPTMQLPTASSSPSVSGASGLFPRVVVVNPTPHPTPPATPQPPSSATAAGPAALAPTHLLPPPARRPLFSAQAASDSSSSSSASSSSCSNAAVAEQQSLSHLHAGASKRDVEATIKPSDRRLFLQQAQPTATAATTTTSRPGPSAAPRKAEDNIAILPSLSQVVAASNSKSECEVEVPEVSPSSGTSSHGCIKSDGVISGGGGGGSGVGDRERGATKRALAKAHARRSRETIRHNPVRPMTSRVQSHRAATTAAVAAAAAQKKAETKRTTFNVGSTSSNGSKGGRSGYGDKDKSLARPERDVPRPRPPSPVKSGRATGNAATTSTAAAAGATTNVRRGLVMSTSSEFETDTDDSEWASEDSGPDEQELARQREESRLREAAEEAQRQRDMFAKIPKRSYTANIPRTKSGLSQLLNPDPAIFPPGHPLARSSFSTQDMTMLHRQAASSSGHLYQHPSGLGQVHHALGPGLGHRREGSATVAPTPPLSTSKSTLAMPLAAQVTAQVTLNGALANGGREGYRPKGRPEEAEMEDDTDSEDDNPENAIQVSRSLAQQKLAALADPKRRRTSERVANPATNTTTTTTATTTATATTNASTTTATRPSNLTTTSQQNLTQVTRPTLPTIATAPIPLNHPYNLPAPAPPTTPRTTRRQMLSTELSESLRRNLLWERQVSKINMTARRSQSGLGLGVGGGVGAGLRALTAVNTTNVSGANGHVAAGGAGGAGAGAGAGVNGGTGGERKEGKKEGERRDSRFAGVARNKSWTDDYHYAGW
ncbi:hypothetical protein K474DRAFT_57230 [Panus rudis PR-1116 ss-1]|nr:hypothetical protein K474DRAFT_57230 [Panus rudis PR-1116 ss-1]